MFETNIRKRRSCVQVGNTRRRTLYRQNWCTFVRACGYCLKQRVLSCRPRKLLVVLIVYVVERRNILYEHSTHTSPPTRLSPSTGQGGSIFPFGIRLARFRECPPDRTETTVEARQDAQPTRIFHPQHTDTAHPTKQVRASGKQVNHTQTQHTPRSKCGAVKQDNHTHTQHTPQASTAGEARSSFHFPLQSAAGLPPLLLALAYKQAFTVG